MSLPENREFSSLRTIVGERLTAVQFVMDYVKLNFVAAEMTILSPIQVFISGMEFRSFEAGFRDQICSLIGSKILEASGVTAQYLKTRI